MARRMKIAQPELHHKHSSKIVILHIAKNSFKNKLEALANVDKGQAYAMPADPTQGAFSGTRSRTSTQRTLAQDDAYNYAAYHANRAATPVVLKITSRSSKRGTTKKAQQAAVKEEVDVDIYKQEDGAPRTEPSSDSDVSSSDSDASPTFNRAATVMATAGKPKLKLSFSKTNLAAELSPVQNPTSQSATRTPSIKLKVKPEVRISTQLSTPEPRAKKRPGVAHGATTTPSAKKRKEPHGGYDSSEDELSKRPAPLRKVTLSQPKPDVPKPPIVRPIIKLKHKGKVPKRPLGVGYDSELSDTEKDPTIIEAFILRMLPGPDCEYLHHAIESGTVGLHRNQNGADVQLMALDHHGRRFVVTVRQHRYAASLVDLPCIVEGMKSWDKKAFIKSADICQMLLVLGRIESVEEAKIYPLPPEVDPKTFQYAHGLTPPMRWVRKRRFARTRRHDPHDIERVERQVQQLLADDAAALSSSYSWYNPQDDDEESVDASEEDDGDQDAEGEEVDDYFTEQNGVRQMVESPVFPATPAEAEDDDDTAQFEALMEAEEDDDVTQSSALPVAYNNTLHPPENDSSFAVTSTSASPSGTAAQTPASVSGDAASSGDEEEEEEDEQGNLFEGAEEADTPASTDDDAQGTNARIQELQEKIDDSRAAVGTQQENLKQHTNQILQKRIMEKIAKFEADIENYERQIREEGGVVEGDGE